MLFGTKKNVTEKKVESVELKQPAPPTPIVRIPDVLPSFDLLAPEAEKQVEQIHADSLEDIFGDIVSEQPKFAQHIELS